MVTDEHAQRAIREINIYVKSHQEKEKIPAIYVASYFQKIQTLLYIIGDYLQGYKLRAGGDFPNTVKNQCELVIKDIKTDSIDAVLVLSDTQVTLIPELGKRCGENAIDIAKKIIDIASTEDDIFSKVNEILPDEDRAYRCIQEIETIWPDQDSRFDVSLNFGKENRQLNPLRKPEIQKALIKTPEVGEKVVYGRLVEIRVDQKRQFQIDSTEGRINCRYLPELEDYVLQNLKNIVKVTGKLTEKEAISIDNRKSIEALKNLPLYQITIQSQIYELRQPLVLEVLYENEQFLFSNDEFHLLAMSNTMEEGITTINEEFEQLIEEYVKSKIQNLTADAIEFRKKVISIFKEGNTFVNN